MLGTSVSDRDFFGFLVVFRFLVFILDGASSDTKYGTPDSGTVGKLTDGNLSRSSYSSKLSSLRNSSSKESKSSRCRLLLMYVAVSEGQNLPRLVTNSLSESRSEKVSNVGKPPRVDAANESNGLLNCDSGLINIESQPNKNLCSSSSPGHSVGNGGKSIATLLKLELGEVLVKFRGSQKSYSMSEMAERGFGEGDGEREGQELIERRSED